jgi:hypothetical protein
VRVFLNRGDRSGLFDDFLPPAPVGQRPAVRSGGFQRGDALPDICVANIDANTVSILLGRATARSAPPERSRGPHPRGVAVLDADGDGDTDIVNTNADTGGAFLLLNDGQGRFGAPAFFDAGGEGRVGAASEDMNGDGILDRGQGYRSGRVMVLAGRGDATFSRLSSAPASGQVWQLATGDLNGDGASGRGTPTGPPTMRRSCWATAAAASSGSDGIRRPLQPCLGPGRPRR